MRSLYDELAEKLAKDPRVTKGGVAKFDTTLLLFNARESLRNLWVAGEDMVSAGTATDSLRDAVDELRPIFGERAEPKK